MKTQNQIRRQYRRQAIEDMDRRLDCFLRANNLHLTDFCRLMVKLGYYSGYVNIERTIREMFCGRASSDSLLKNVYNTIQRFAGKEKEIARILGQRRIGFKDSPIGFSVDASDRKFTENGTLGDRYVRRFLREAND